MTDITLFYPRLKFNTTPISTIFKKLMLHYMYGNQISPFLGNFECNIEHILQHRAAYPRGMGVVAISNITSPAF
jgi:hypothetical protein